MGLDPKEQGCLKTCWCICPGMWGFLLLMPPTFLLSIGYTHDWTLREGEYLQAVCHPFDISINIYIKISKIKGKVA